jgi:3,4-dihydroxy-9,10-secoandrosta-1,3,5(10)-triene-9,17-dione 4,5-dioxygenase
MLVKELGYVVLNATDLDAWRRYGTQVLGLMANDLPDGSLNLRMDERECRILVKKSDKDRLSAIGWLLTDKREFLLAQSEVAAAGYELVIGSEQECVERRVNGFFAVTDPAGHRHEIAWGPLVNFRQPFVSPVGITKYLTGDQGLGHIVVGCEPEQFEPCHEFVQNVLGFNVANIRKQSLDDSSLMPVTWFHVGNSRQHSLGLAPAFQPDVERHGCRHINLEVMTIDEVGCTMDRAQRAGVRLARTLGRHVNDRAISFYMFNPSGFLFEFGCDAPAKNWSQEIVFDEGGAGSVWGHSWIAAR